MTGGTSKHCFASNEQFVGRVPKVCEFGLNSGPANHGAWRTSNDTIHAHVFMAQAEVALELYNLEM